jgi:hypothetical protein
VLGAVLCALALAGCGFAVGAPPTGVGLLVTRDFGAQVLRHQNGLRARENETVLSLLSRIPALRETVTGGGGGGAQVRWVYYINGVQAPKRASATKLLPGDHVWWDEHEASQAPATPAAVVGSFPQPFLDGINGKRLPVRVECTSVSGAACASVIASLRALGVPAAVTAVGSGGAPETLRVMVGPWNRIGGDLEAQSIAHGPRSSGVYARFSATGLELTLLDQQGGAVRTLGAGAGLVAATQTAKEAPVWVVTGTDDAGVELAARAFNRPALEDHFALALQPGGATPLPVAPAPVPTSAG